MRGPKEPLRLTESISVLHDACRALGLQTDVELVSVIGFRWTLDYTQSKSRAHPDFAKSMIKLERHLQEKLKRPIDLRLESESDKNKRKQRNVLG